MTSDFESFYTRRLYTRIRDCWNRPITGVPGRYLNILQRTSFNFNKSFTLTGHIDRAMNFSSYNYLGFAQSDGYCADNVEVATAEYRVAVASPRLEAGTLDIHVRLEQLVAEFLGKEDAMVISMGFATNSTTLPALVSKGIFLFICICWFDMW